MGGQIAAYYGIQYVFFFTAGRLVVNAIRVHHIDKIDLASSEHVLST